MSYEYYYTPFDKSRELFLSLQGPEPESCDYIPANHALPMLQGLVFRVQAERPIQYDNILQELRQRLLEDFGMVRYGLCALLLQRFQNRLGAHITVDIGTFWRQLQRSFPEDNWKETTGKTHGEQLVNMYVRLGFYILQYGPSFPLQAWYRQQQHSLTRTGPSSERDITNCPFYFFTLRLRT